MEQGAGHLRGSHESAGFLDITEDGTLEIHDWYEYAGKLIDQREAEKQRSRRRRAAAAADRRTTDGQTEGQPAGKPGSSQRETAGRVDQTTPDQTTPEKESETLDSVLSAGPTPSSRSLTCITKSAQATRF